MAGAEAVVDQNGWANLAELWRKQQALAVQIVTCTEAALAAAREGALERAQVALAERAELMAESERLEKQAAALSRALGHVAARPGELLGGVPIPCQQELKAAYEGRLEALKRALALNTELTGVLTGFKRKLQGNIEELAGLRRTALQYRPKDVTGEGRFFDSRG